MIMKMKNYALRAARTGAALVPVLFAACGGEAPAGGDAPPSRAGARVHAHEYFANWIKNNYSEELANDYRGEVRSGAIQISYPDLSGNGIFVYRDASLDLFEDGTMAYIKLCSFNPCDVETSTYTLGKFRAQHSAGRAGKNLWKGAKETFGGFFGKGRKDLGGG